MPIEVWVGDGWWSVNGSLLDAGDALGGGSVRAAYHDYDRGLPTS